MDIRQLKILLDKYNRAETNLDEEQMLREYFSGQSDIPAELEPYRTAFRYFDTMRHIAVQEPELESKLDALIDREQNHKPVIMLNRKVIRWISAAALVVLISTMVLVVNKNRKPDLGTYDDPALAYQEAQRTLLYISQTMNHGTKELSNISKINSSVQNLKNLEKLNSGMDKLKLFSKLNETATNENNK
jgi:hypothetical protein